MLIKRRRGWELPDSAAVPESVFLERRRLCRSLAAGPVLLAAAPLLSASGLGPGAAPAFAAEAAASAEWARAAEGAEDPTSDLYPVARNMRYRVERPVTDEALVTRYNNFYEFGAHKGIWRAAQKMPIRPWQVRVDGLVEKPFTIDVDRLIRKMPLEERVLRFRCVEAWSFVAPWSGFPMRALVEMAKPLSSAGYVEMETLLDPEVMPGTKAVWFPWPYVEGLTMAEATHELAFLVTGLYGRPVPKQDGAPLRLLTPWKYGFKSVKSIVRFTFTEARPKTFWSEVQGNEYGFWANVNPEVPHPRWSQATEKVLGSGERIPTRLFNGYGEFVAGLYKGLEGEKLFM